MADFMAARDRLTEQYKAQESAFYVDTRPVESTVYFAASVVPDLSAGTAYAVFSPQKREPWGYGRKDLVPGLGLQATEADTALDVATRTPKGIDFAIEGFSAKSVQVLPRFDPSNTDTATRPFLASDAEASAIFHDPGAIVSPPQCDSPINLEPTLYRAIAQAITCRVKFDSSGDVELGTLDGWPSGPDTYLHAHGSPSYADRFGLKEGFIWRGEGSDSRLTFAAELVKTVVVPLHLRQRAGVYVAPTKLLVGVKFRLHGAGFRFASVNT